MRGSRLLGIGLRLNSRKGKGLARAAFDGVPIPETQVLVPGHDADPGLDAVVEAEAHVVRLGDLARGVRDLVLGALVLELEDAPFWSFISPVHRTLEAG